MYLIGLCGKSGSGKTVVASFLQERGVYTIDADSVCHRVYAENSACISEIAEEFGSVVVVNGVIDRSLLAKLAFSVPGGIDTLNSISHKYIINEIEEEAALAFKAGKNFVLIDAPTLFEAGLDRKCNAIVAVVSKTKAMECRLIDRDGIALKEINLRHQAQVSNSELRNKADVVIVNDCSLLALRRRTYQAMLVIQLKLGSICRCQGGVRYKVKHS